jgi:type I restriction enzyme S subunit
MLSLGALALKLTDGSHNPPRDNGSGFPMLSSQNIRNGAIDFARASRFLTPEDFVVEDLRTAIAPGDVLLTIVASIGRSAVVEAEAPKFALQRSVAVFRTLLVPKFLSLFLRSPAASCFFWTHAKGTAQKGIYLGKLAELDVPVPSLAEQHRIVAKVDELMALCSRLEARQQDAETAHAQLVQVLLDSLTQARDADEFRASWQRLAGQFQELFTTEASTDKLVEAILELAVRGKLVDQSPDDEPATEVLREIATTKERLIEEGLRTTAQVDVPAEDRYVPLPGGWAFARLGNLARFIDYRGRTPVKTESGIPLITAKNVRPGCISREPREYIAADDYDSWMTRGLPRAGDMLFTTEAPLGNIALIDIQERFALAQRVICFQLHQLDLGPFLRIVLMSRTVQAEIAAMATGMTAAGVKASRLKELPLPIPPLAEQRRIVAKVTELLALCDQLKARIAAARAKQAHLAEAMVSKAVAA